MLELLLHKFSKFMFLLMCVIARANSVAHHRVMLMR